MHTYIKVSANSYERTFFDLDWQRLPFTQYYPSSKDNIKKPENFDEMIRMAELMSKDIPYARMDFYEVDGRIYFGEITLYPNAGYQKFTPEEWDATLGEWITLPAQRTTGSK